MKDRRILMYSFLMCIATGCTVYRLTEYRQKKIAVVDAVKLFDRFNMKKELESKEKIKLELIKKQADSIGNQLQLARAGQDEASVKKLAYAYNYAKAELENEFKMGNREINEQVWKRLNPTVNEYGKKKGLHVIIGANGMGSVLYNDDYYDLTEDLIKYVNQKYEGVN